MITQKTSHFTQTKSFFADLNGNLNGFELFYMMNKFGDYNIHSWKNKFSIGHLQGESKYKGTFQNFPFDHSAQLICQTNRISEITVKLWNPNKITKILEYVWFWPLHALTSIWIPFIRSISGKNIWKIHFTLVAIWKSDEII